MVRFGVLMFFFFQAEDGIRDYKVTGVQTCALPILDVAFPFGEDLTPCARAIRGRKTSPPRGTDETRICEPSSISARSGWSCRKPRSRSEERRVGKECRSWGAP